MKPPCGTCTASASIPAKLQAFLQSALDCRHHKPVACWISISENGAALAFFRMLVPQGAAMDLPPPEELIQFPAPGAARLKAVDMLLSVAQRAIILRIDDARLRSRVEPLLAQLRVAEVDNEQVNSLAPLDYKFDSSNKSALTARNTETVVRSLALLRASTTNSR